MRTLRLAVIVATISCLAGCATSSGVIKIGADIYAVSVSADRGSSAKEAAHEQVNAECHKQGKEAFIVSEQSGHISVNGTVDFIFICRSPANPALTAL